jgi:alkanesulfonate monooxygenase SsuD/methylene tetrahydromethanopterin reductase-like flavin-dependent oxidoreductase (luciferase family)
MLDGDKGRNAMDVGLQLIFTSYGYGEEVTDADVYEQDLSLALAAEDLGFDVLWPVEHHFFDYSFCPDNLQLLAYLAGRMSNIDVGSAAVILPWNEPLRVAEKVALLDHLSGGRVRFGMGRGLSRREFAPFRSIEMDESRERFDEAAPMIVEALETGFIEGEGPFYPQPRTEIRPRPARSFKGRIYAVANSSDSIDACARIGGRMIMFSEARWDRRLPGIQRHRELFQELHGVAAPPVMTADFTFCHSDPVYAKEAAEQYQATYLQSILEHYELMGTHLDEMKGYQGYGKQAARLREIGFEKYVDGFLAANAYGTPEQILAKLRARLEVIGPFELATCFRYGGIPFDEAEASMRLFATEVLPELKGW